MSQSPEVSDMWLVGAGIMAQGYAKVLTALDVDFTTIGRGRASADEFEAATGKSVELGGLDLALSKSQAPDQAIVAVGIDVLMATTAALMEAGTRNILVEKPAGLSLDEIERLESIRKATGARVLLGYNRRFYSAVRVARQMIEEDGGVSSAHFEITEWGHRIGPSDIVPNVKQRWFLGNTSHVVDLAFYLIGNPTEWHSMVDAPVDWHSAGSRFSGSGKTDRDAFFSYFGDWQAPGRWGLEFLTRKRRLILRPMEVLQVTLGSVEAELIETDEAPEAEFKPGLYFQTKAFLAEDDQCFCSLTEQSLNAKLYSQMAGYL